MFIPIDIIINKIYNIDIIIKFKTMYVLKTNDHYIDQFETLEEAKEAVNKLELEDRETNSNIKYEIILKEDYIENLKTELKINIGNLKIKQRVIWESIRKDLEEFNTAINNLLK